MEQINEARKAAEITLGFPIPEEVADEVLAFAKRKCTVSGQPDSYLPLLYENELTDFFMRAAINQRGGMNRVYGARDARALA